MALRTAPTHLETDQTAAIRSWQYRTSRSQVATISNPSLRVHPWLKMCR
jgi:hypothetical protein